jgi:tetratricopeptide (TPR) repeat protein
MARRTILTVGAALLFCASGLAAQAQSGAAEEARKGLELAKEGKYPDAITHYRAAAALDPNLPGLFVNLGLAHFKLGQFPDAITAFEKAAKSGSTYQLHVLLGMSYLACRRFDAAAVELKQAVVEQPDNLELRYKLAQSYLWSKQYPDAIEEFRGLLTRDPNSSHVHMLLGEVLDASNHLAEATAEFEAAVKSSHPEPEAHFGLGYLYWKQKRYPEAAREFRAELADQPQHVQSLTYLGDTLMHDGDDKAAAEYLARAVHLDPAIRLAQLDLGIVLSDSDPAEAARHLRDAIRLDASNPDAHYRLGRLLRSQGREEEAAAEFAKVKALAAKEEQPPPLLEVPGRKNESQP